MKMLVMMFRSSLDDEILSLLHQLNITGFTLAPKVLGQGATGQVFDSYAWPGCNAMLFTALPDGRVEEVLDALRKLRDRLSQRQHGAKIPLHIFSLDCEQML